MIWVWAGFLGTCLNIRISQRQFTMEQAIFYANLGLITHRM